MLPLFLWSDKQYHFEERMYSLTSNKDGSPLPMTCKSWPRKRLAKRFIRVVPPKSLGSENKLKVWKRKEANQLDTGLSRVETCFRLRYRTKGGTVVFSNNFPFFSSFILNSFTVHDFYSSKHNVVRKDPLSIQFQVSVWSQCTATEAQGRRL